MRLTVEHLTKIYTGGKIGLDDFSLELGSGILGLLGPNGAGKSTLMRIIATVSRPTAGRVLWNGRDIRRHPNALRQDLGYLPQDFGVYPHLNAVEFLEYMAAVKGLSGAGTRRRIEALLDQLNLLVVRKQPVGTFSGGMRQRIGIAQVLLNDPAVLILDEPTVGLDPEERVRFRQLLSHLAGERVIILSSHIVSDIETIAGDIAIMNSGRLLERNTVARILRHVENRVFEADVPLAELDRFKSGYLVSNLLREGEAWRVRYIIRNSDAPGGRNPQPVKTTLEDAYLFLTRNASEESR
ncbi:MAG: ATP-binding cassette domain-containing protein [Acidobacteria bacterium]|nr:ATP-binding cassette domain-containing protein [Acidobacteriota bacterium]